jgi:integrase
MPKTRLSADKIKRHALPKSGAVELVDTDAPGLICRITSGGAKTMAVKARIKGSSTFRISLGEYTLRPLDGSDGWRARARMIMAQARDGLDPRVQNLDVLTFAQARDRYLANPPPVSRGSRIGQPWSASHLRDTTRYLTQDATKLEKLKLRNVTGAHVVAAISSIKTTPLRRAAYAALSAFFSWCVNQRLVEISPALSLKAPPAAASRERELTRTELTAVMSAASEMGYPFGHLYRLMLLTGKRKGEVAKMRWQDIDLDAAEWTIQSNQTKSGNALVEPLSRQAVELVRSCPQFGPYVFTTNGRSPVSGFSKAERRLYALTGNEGDDSWRVHDFRRSLVSTAAREFRTPIAIADRHLNHAGGARGVARVYQRYDLLREREELAQQWAEWLCKTENVGRLHSA